MKLSPLPAFLAFTIVVLAMLGAMWIPLPPSNEELVGYAGKLDYLLELVRKEGGIPWWIPGYLSGYSGAAVMSYVAGMLPYAAGTIFFDTITAFKVVGLILMGLGGLAAYALGRRLSGSGWAGFATGALFLLSPQVLSRLGWQEHMTIVAAYPLVPLCFLALSRVAESGSRFDSQLLAMAYSGALLCWPKIGATLVVPLAIFGGWLYATRPELRRNLIYGFLWAAPITLLLGVLPLLPLVRESRFMTIFELGPFDGWQATFSARTTTSWFDRSGELFAGMPEGIRVSRGGYYLGLLPLACLAFLVVRSWRSVPEEDRRRVSVIKAFVGITLAMFWLSFGPRNVLEGHFEFLEQAHELRDWVLPIHWLALGAPAALLWWLLPAHPSKRVFYAGALAVWYLVPGFRLIELIPVFRDLRAPDSFWILGGTVPWCVAGGLAIQFTITQLPLGIWRAAAGIALAIGMLEASPYLSRFSQGSLGAKIQRDFAETQKFLRERPLPGRVLAVSGRYFYLQVPPLSGRPLVTEAAHLNFMARDAARLHSAAWKSAPAMAAYGNLAGVSHILVDKTDPGTTPEIQQWLRSIWPVAFENEHFAVLENPSALYPAFAGPGTDLEHPPEIDESTHALVMSTYGTVSLPEGITAAPVSGDTKLARLSAARPEHPGSLALSAPKGAGWVVLSEAWHPDWRATIDGRDADVVRVAAAFPGVFAPDGGEVEFRFTPPWWYPVCIFAAIAGWLMAMGSLLLQVRKVRKFDARNAAS